MTSRDEIAGRLSQVSTKDEHDADRPAQQQGLRVQTQDKLRHK